MKDDEYASPGDAIFARSLRALRESRGISQRAMADLLATRGLNFNFTTIGRIERGDRRVTVGEAAVLADVLGSSVERLLDQHDDLTRAYKAQAQGRDSLASFSAEYLTNLLRVAVSADRADALSARDRDWLATELELHTPSYVASEAHGIARDFLVQQDIDPETPYVSRTLARLEADLKALRAVRDDG